MRKLISVLALLSFLGACNKDYPDDKHIQKQEIGDQHHPKRILDNEEGDIQR